MLRPARIGALVAFVLLVAAQAAFAFSTPQRTGWVTDAAHILDDSTMSSLSTRLQNLQAQTGDEVVVVTVPDLQGVPVEDWGNVLGTQWKIGNVNGRNNGVVLVVAPNDRRVRIAVGYGLANRIPDSMAATIISDHIIPYFRNGDMAGGITAGITSIALQLGVGGAAPANSVQVETVAAPPVRLSFWGWLVHGVYPSPHTLMIMFWVGVGIVIFVVMALNAANVGSGNNSPRSLSDEYDNAYNSDTGWSNNDRGGSGRGWSGGGGGGGSFGGGASGSW